MSDSQKPKEFWISPEDEWKRTAYSTREDLRDDTLWIHVIEYGAYQSAIERIEKLRAALLDLYETTKVEHGVHESEIEPWDSSSLGNAKGALIDDQGEEI